MRSIAKASTILFTTLATLAVLAGCAASSDEEVADTDEELRLHPPCHIELGKAAAAQLAEQCLQVSPATHPPCNVANSCTMIRSEILRGCDLIGDANGALPAFCSCTAQGGPVLATKLVNECVQVSTATHPACNRGDTCKQIRTEIDRSCALFHNRPGVCLEKRSCAEVLGVAEADKLVTTCMRVSPATHPPCNASNPCEVIRSEIQRSCNLFGGSAPAECKAQ
jgi:hypothetical protein